MKDNYALLQRRMNRSKKSHRLLGRFYSDNFQLRALAGCTSGDCLDELDIDEAKKKRMQHQSASLTPNDSPNCTQYFRNSDTLFDTCHKDDPQYPSTECPDGCDGPCFYETTMASGPLERKHLYRAMHSLETFDAVLFIH